MNLALTDEQRLLVESARQALARRDPLDAARAALDGLPTADLWRVATQAGWPGLLAPESLGGSQLAVHDALLLAETCGRYLADTHLSSHWAGTQLLVAGGDQLAGAATAGDVRVAWSPLVHRGDGWGLDAALGRGSAPLPSAGPEGGEGAAVIGAVPCMPDAAGAAALVVVTEEDGVAGAVVVDSAAGGVELRPHEPWDGARPLACVSLAGARARRLDISPDDLASVAALQQALLAAEALGAAEAAHAMALAYAKERRTFGRTIGSYQAIKHQLVEGLRLCGLARSLLVYAAWAAADEPAQAPLAAAAARVAAGRALDHTAAQNLAVHGAVGVTWEHDAHLYSRRAALLRRLAGGTAGAAALTAREFLAGAYVVPREGW